MQSVSRHNVQQPVRKKITFRVSFVVLLTLSMLLQVQSLKAQEIDTAACVNTQQFMLGVSGGIHSIQHTFSNRMLAPTNFTFDPATSLGWFAGVVTELRMDTRWSLSLDVRYNELSGSSSFAATSPTGQFLIASSSDSSGEYIYLDNPVFSYTSAIDYASLSFGILANWREISQDTMLAVGLSAGPVIHAITRKELHQTEHLESHINVRFINPNGLPTEDDGRTFIYYSGELENSRSLRVGFHLGLFAELGNPASGLVISPGIFYDYGLQTVTSTENWYVHTLSGRMMILVGL